MSILPVGLYVHYMCTWVPQKSEKSIKSPGTKVMDGCDPPRGFWKLNLSPLREQQVLLTGEPSVQPLTEYF